MASSIISVSCHSLAVVRRGHRFLLIQEAKPGQPWYIPAGGVEKGETFMAAIHREVMEEAGIGIELAGILGMEHAPEDYGARMRVIFLAHPSDDEVPKSVADDESIRADWFSLEEIAELPLRHAEALNWCQLALDGGLVMPVEMLGDTFRFG